MKMRLTAGTKEVPPVRKTDPLRSLKPRAPEQGIHTVLNRGQVVSNPALELSPRNRNTELDRRCTRCSIAEDKLRGFLLR